jgi:hypothetical protein
MKPFTLLFARPCLALALTLPCSLFAAAAGAGAPATPAASAQELSEVPKSVFAIPATIKDGRNPFFPYAPQPKPVPAPGPSQVITEGFILNGITSPPKRTAMINGRTFEVGESAEVRVGGSKVLIKCEDIRDSSVIINVGGQSRELRFRPGAY